MADGSFYQYVFNTQLCAGCGQKIGDVYWELKLPPTRELIVEYLALCDDCHQDMNKQGVVL